MSECEKCGDEREQITGLLCYPCRCGMQEREMQELRATIEQLKAALIYTLSEYVYQGDEDGGWPEDSMIETAKELCRGHKVRQQPLEEANEKFSRLTAALLNIQQAADAGMNEAMPSGVLWYIESLARETLNQADEVSDEQT